MRYKFKHEPYAHQLEALEESWNKDYFAFFMDMGTGKSKVLIDNVAILYDQGKVDSALIVAPKSVYKNWELKELPAHLPDHITADIVAWSPHKTQKKLKELSMLGGVLPIGAETKFTFLKQWRLVELMDTILLFPLQKITSNLK